MNTQHTASGTEHELVLSAERLQHSVVRTPRERVRVSKRITTEMRTLQVPVRVEQLVVRHEPMADGERPAEVQGAEPPEDLVLVLHEEVPVVSLQVRPTERVRLSVRQVAGRQVVTETLRHEEVDLRVDELPREPAARTAHGGPPGAP